MHSEANKPDYVDSIHVARMFGQNPQVVDQEWDVLWINRVKLVMDAEASASTAKRQQAIDDKKE